MKDKEYIFTVDLNDFVRPAVLCVLAVFALRVGFAVNALAIVRITDGENAWACLAIMAMAFGSLFTDAIVAGIIGFYSAAKSWLGQTIILACVGLIIAGAISYFC